MLRNCLNASRIFRIFLSENVLFTMSDPHPLRRIDREAVVANEREG